MVSEEAYKKGGRCRGICKFGIGNKLDRVCKDINVCYQYKQDYKKQEITDGETLKENKSPKYLELTNPEILWLSNLMCGEADGSKESDSLENKIDKLYQEVFNK